MEDAVGAQAGDRRGDVGGIEQVDRMRDDRLRRRALPARPHQAVDLVAELGAMGDQVAAGESGHARDEHAHLTRLPAVGDRLGPRVPPGPPKKNRT
jgi:hypothetical protein